MSDLAVILGGLVALILGVLGYGQAQRRAGRKEAKHDAEQADTERALDIRRNADRVDERLHDYGQRGFRD